MRIGNEQAATEALKQARQTFLQYRKGGGENKEQLAQLCHTVVNAIKLKDDSVISIVKEGLTSGCKDYSSVPMIVAFLESLLDILSGNRNPALPNNRELFYQHSVELELFLEFLASVEKQPS